MKRLLSLLGVLVFAGVSHAQTFEVVHCFTRTTGYPSGRLVQTADGSFVGTTERGGRFGKGSIYRLVPDGLGGYTNVELHSFFGPDGQAPHGGLIVASDGQLYGTTYGGGAFFGGTVYRFDTNGRVTTIHDFQNPDGAAPQGELVEYTDGFLYGTTNQGGANGLGTIFRTDRSGNLTFLHSFGSSDDGFLPASGLTIGPAGALYGTTIAGGASNGGVVYRLETDGSTTVLHPFAADTDGFSVFAALILGSDGRLYGTAAGGGPNGTGTIFRVDAAGTFDMLFGLASSDGATSVAPLVEASPGVFVGAASFGGTTNDGTVFRFELPSTFTRIYSFSLTDGEYPYSGLVPGPDGLFYGTTTTGGPEGLGEVYRIDTLGNLEIVAPFGNEEGISPSGALLQAADGNLYGTAGGGPHGVGTIFRIEPGDVFHLVHGLIYQEGMDPKAALIQGPDGIYGLASSGGANFLGSIFRVQPTGELEVLHSFATGEGDTPIAALIQGPDDFFYGTASAGGSGGVGGQGTIFRVDSLGAFEKLWDFLGPEGAFPQGPLILGSDGDFYGTTSGGGQGEGTVFRFNTTDGATLVHEFVSPDGASPWAALLETSPGVFLGTAAFGGANGNGTLFRMDASFTVVHPFGSGGFDAGEPLASLTVAADTNLYGTTRQGGDQNTGAIFRVDGSDTVTTVHSFRSAGGMDPRSQLLAAADGALYGTAPLGGVNDTGTVYRLLLTTVDPSIIAVDPHSGPAVGGSSLVISGAHFQPLPALSIGPESPAALGVESNSILAVAPFLTAGALYDITVTNADATTATLKDAWFADFLDVDALNPFHDDVEAIIRAGITAGCGGGNYCVNAAVTRAQMAVFLLKAKLGADHVPPPATGTVFLDVPQGSFAADWIEELAGLGITGGCGGGNYCPGSPVTRAQMAVFLLKTSLGSGYVPPVVAQIFDDVAPGDFAADWINDLYGRGITGGCSVAPLLYCPANANTRGQMAVFLTKTFLQP